MTSRQKRRHTFAAYLVGTLLIQAAWILTLPAFRGIDEFDHVYKAAAVARGQWTAPDAAPHGRGGVVTIPESIVRAASPVCRTYAYTGHDNCFPIGITDHGQADVATAAGAYNPAYYVVAGTLARPFGGAGADFAMRVVTAVMCALLIAWAAALITRWALTPWPLVTLTIGLTPVLLYSTAIAGPNGLTYAAAVLLWAGLIGLAKSESGGHGFVLPLTVASVTLVVTHTTGTMWLALAVLTVLILRPIGHWTRLLRRRPTTWAVAACVVVAAVALCQFWARLAHTNALGTKSVESGALPLHELPLFHTLWALQSIAVFPLRDERAPAAVYVIWGVILLGVLVVLFRLGGLRERLAGLAVLGLLALVPTVLTAVSYRTESYAWQGRYSLPLWLGITSLAGLVLDRRRQQPSPRIAWVLFALLATAMAISTVHVGLHEISHGATKPVVTGYPGGMLFVGLLTALGAMTPLILMGARRANVTSEPSATEHVSIST